MHKIVCWLQIGAVLTAASLVVAMSAYPYPFQSKAFAEPDITVDQYIARLANGRTEWQKYNAAAALGELGDEKAIPHLVRALGSPNESVRENAVAALRQLRATDAKAAIEDLLDDPSPAVQANARAALRDFEALATMSPIRQATELALVVGPAAVIVAALWAKLVLYPRHRTKRIASVVQRVAWPAGLVFAWLALRAYPVSETRKIVGVPVVAAVLEFDGHNWVDYSSSIGPVLLALDAVYGLFVPQVLLALVLGVITVLSKRGASA